jgi:hypothetical protein
MLSMIWIVFAGLALAQEGHRTDITLVMDWDGKVITGIVNPGFEQMALQNAKLNAANWTLHFEVESKDSSGKPVRCMVDGKIDKLGSDRRTLAGTWNCGTAKADFQLTRDRDY